jgi:hypothetical protein
VTRNVGGRPPVPDGYDSLTFRGPTPLVGKFRDRVGKGARSEVIRSLLAWYLREPGAKLPTRPAVDGAAPATSDAAAKAEQAA